MPRVSPGPPHRPRSPQVPPWTPHPSHPGRGWGGPGALRGDSFDPGGRGRKPLSAATKPPSAGGDRLRLPPAVDAQTLPAHSL